MIFSKIFVPIATAALAVVIANREQFRTFFSEFWKNSEKANPLRTGAAAYWDFLEATVCVISQTNCESKTSRWSAQLLTSDAAQQDMLRRLLHHGQGSLFDLATDRHIMWPGKKNVYAFVQSPEISPHASVLFLWYKGGFFCVSTRHIFYFNFGNFEVAMETHQGSLCFPSSFLVLTVPARRFLKEAYSGRKGSHGALIWSVPSFRFKFKFVTM